MILGYLLAPIVLVGIHVKLIFKLAFTLVNFLVRGTRTWIWNLICLVTFTIILIPGWISLVYYYITDSCIVKQVAYTTEGSLKRHVLDIYLPPSWSKPCSKQLYTPRRVIIFVSGGAWTIGYKMWSALTCRGLSRLGFICLSPDYRNFPQTDLEGMKDDIRSAIVWAHENCDSFGGDPDNLIVAGQSAGAHIVACILVDWLTQKLAQHSIGEGVHENEYEHENGLGLGVGGGDGNLLKHPGIEEAEEVKRGGGGGGGGEGGRGGENDKFHQVASSIKCFIGVSGPYNLVQLQSHLHTRGLDSSILNWICRNDLKRYSPSAILSDLLAVKGNQRSIQKCSNGHAVDNISDNVNDDGEMKKAHEKHVDTSSLFKQFPQTFLFHGTSDSTIPAASCISLERALLDGGAEASIKYYSGFTHTDPILEGPLSGDERLFIDIKESIDKATGKASIIEDVGKLKSLPSLPRWLISIARKINPF